MNPLPCPPELWPEFSKLLDQALETPDADRARWLDQLALEHQPLRPWLARVLKADARNRTGDFLGQPQLAPAAEGESGFCRGQSFGPYRLESPLGRGGMGEVWRARRTDGQLDRDVALKLPHSWMISGAMRQRLHRERDILASLSHPHIAQLYDAGVAQGQPFLALELIDGVPIDHYCVERQLSLATRIALFAQVLEAVRHAHSRLIVHRDLKPSNILVTGEGQAKLLDFGIAKLLDEQGDGAATELTRLGGRALTLAYAAPEQISGDTVTVATDVYALGVILFELLAGRRPFETRPDRSGQREPAQDVPLASQRLASEHAERVGGLGTRQLAGQLAGDLDAILCTALAHDAAQRYGSVEAFAEDLQRHLRLEPIRARRIGRAERIGRFVLRNRLAVAMSGALAATLVAGVAGVVWQGQRAQQAAVQARAEATRADLTKNFVLDLLIANDTRIPANRPRNEIPVGELLDLGLERVERDFSDNPDAQLELLDIGMTIRSFWRQEAQGEKLLARRAEIARQKYGEHHPAVIQWMIHEAGRRAQDVDRKAGLQQLDAARRALDAAGLQRSCVAAQWWQERYYLFRDQPHEGAVRVEALDRIVELASEFCPEKGLLPLARLNLADEYFEVGRYPEAARMTQTGIDTVVTTRGIDLRNAFLSHGYLTLALSLERVDDRSGADRAWTQAEQRRVDGWDSSFEVSLEAMALHAWSLQRRGDVDAARAKLQQSLADAQNPAVTTAMHLEVRQVEAFCLLLDDRNEEALDRLESIAKELPQWPEAELPEFRRLKGEAYARAGRSAEARMALDEARTRAAEHWEAGNAERAMSEERWGRSLLDQGEVDAAASSFERVLREAVSLDYEARALAHGGLARIALGRNDLVEAQEHSAQAIRLLGVGQGFEDRTLIDDLRATRMRVLEATSATRPMGKPK